MWQRRWRNGKVAVFPERITEETFAQAWEYTAQGLCRAKRRFAMEVPVSVVTNGLFFCGAVLVSLGVVMEDVPVAAEYARSLTWVAQWWDVYRAWLYSLALEPRQMQILTMGLLFAIPFAVAIPISVVIRLVYHPKKPLMPEGTRKEKAWELLDTAKRARAYTRRAAHNSETCFGLLFVLTVFAFVAYVLFVSSTRGVILVESSQYAALSIALGILGFFFVYCAMTALLRVVTKPLYYYRFPQKAMEEADRYLRMISQTQPENAPEEQVAEGQQL